MKFSHGPWSLWTQKSPLEVQFFGNFFGLYVIKLFMGNNSFFIHFVMQIDRKGFFLRFLKKKSEISHFGRFYITKCLHSGHFFITKFCQDAKKNYFGKGLTTNKVSTDSVSLYGRPKITQFHLEMHIYG